MMSNNPRSERPIRRYRDEPRLEPRRQKSFSPAAYDSAIGGIVQHSGIALHCKHASYVASQDKAQRDRVHDGFLKNDLALTASDDELDTAIIDVCEKMKADRDKSRVPFRCFLAEKFEKLAALY
jgi:hypothetical protein